MDTHRGWAVGRIDTPHHILNVQGQLRRMTKRESTNHYPPFYSRINIICILPLANCTTKCRAIMEFAIDNGFVHRMAFTEIKTHLVDRDWSMIHQTMIWVVRNLQRHTEGKVHYLPLWFTSSKGDFPFNSPAHILLHIHIMKWRMLIRSGGLLAILLN